METNIVTRETLGRMLIAANKERQKQIVGRALVVLFKKQTTHEQRTNAVVEANNVGFSSADGVRGCIVAKYYLKHGTLTDWMLADWMRDWRGSPHIIKYTRQLNIAAVERALAKRRYELDSPIGEMEATRIAYEIEVLAKFLKK